MTLPEVGSGMQIPVLLFFIPNQLRKQLMQKKYMDIYIHNIIWILMYIKYNKDIFLSVQYLRLFSSGSVCDGFC